MSPAPWLSFCPLGIIELMKIKPFTSAATPKERFFGVFILLLVVWSISAIFVFSFTDTRSNIIWHGEEIRGWRLFVANCFLIPAGAALLAALAAVEHWIFRRRP